MRCALLALFTSCAGTHLELTPTGPTLPPRGEHCAFQVFTEPPNRPFTELGLLEYKIEVGGHLDTKLADFEDDIQEHVCAAGGDGAIVYNEQGVYMRAKVIKLGAAAGLAASPSPTGSASGGSPDSSSAAGCQFDNQCKGDRICVRGECTAPPQK
jgi:hypothetical protein